MLTTVKFMRLMVAGIAIAITSFIAGYSISEHRHENLIQSFYYTGLLTDTRWHITLLDSIKAKNVETTEVFLMELLKQDLLLLGALDGEKKLNTEGRELLEKAQNYVHRQ
jgi:hypothetical protein